MLMFLEAIDDAFVDIVKTGPPYPMETVAMSANAPEHYAIKEKSKLSDAKNLDNMMSNRVIVCKTAKEIWDALETQCQGTMAIKKNRRAVFVQEYEKFDPKADESINDIYDRFLTLLNDLSLVGKNMNGKTQTPNL
ncbi:uncharacterized protein LOC141685629 [Apium graveolens]|uniref:uncharacterized protein LOC141685629 n=1 Tax=Apium graveolens TaxID=4045 RepID=UPI003D7A3827